MSYPTLVEVFERSAAQYAEKIALRLPKPVVAGEDGQAASTCSYEEISFRELKRLSDECAEALHRLGIRPGDKVALLSRPRIEWAVSMLGLLKLGAITVPIDPHLVPAEVQRILHEMDACMAISDHAHLKHVRGVLHLRQIITMDRADDSRLLALSDLLRERRDPPMNAIKPSDLAFILCTSGTTGCAKGVMLAHENLTSNLTGVFERLSVTSQDVVLSIAPWNHIFGLIVLWAALWKGAKLIYTDDYKNLAQLMVENQITILTAVPKLYHAMFAKVETEISKRFLGRLLYRRLPKLVGWRLKKKLSKKLRFFLSGSAPLDPAVEQGFRKLGIGLIEGYGMTETSPVLTFSTPFNEKYGSVGPPLPNIEMKIEDPNEEGIGEVLVRGPNVMRGYYKNEKLTRKTIDPDGWLHTGDLGFLDEDGWLHLKGRKKNVIVLDTGKNVYPEEVEWELGRSPLIEDILVKGAAASQSRTGYKGVEIIQAFVYPNWENVSARLPQIRLEDLRAPMRAQIKQLIWEEIKSRSHNLAPYKRIRSEQDVIIVEKPFEKTSTLDIKRYLYQ